MGTGTEDFAEVISSPLQLAKALVGRASFRRVNYGEWLTRGGGVCRYLPLALGTNLCASRERRKRSNSRMIDHR